jgi:hypothetical protein
MRESRAVQLVDGRWSVAEYEYGNLISTSGSVVNRDVAVQVADYRNRQLQGEAMKALKVHEITKAAR